MLSEERLEHFAALCRDRIGAVATADDPAHDLLHFERVVATARRLCAEEGARLEVVLPAAWLHDLVNVPKNDPRRAHASRLSAESALVFLKEIEYPAELWPDIAHAIEAHSFSARIEARTPEAAIVQDADRLDGLGAIGIARTMATGGLLGRAFYAADDPFCATRPPDDATFTVDHFYAKLFRTAETLRTAAGRREGARRVAVMSRYLDDLAREI
jgi:uncharacterized protein